METKAEHAERMRRYRAEHKEHMKTLNKKYQQRKTQKAREKRYGDKRCAFCGILVAAKSMERKHTKYCGSCLQNKRVQRQLRALYMRRYRQKKKNLPQEPISFPDVDI